MRRLFIVATLLIVLACGRAPSSPSEPPASPTPATVVFADFSGLWNVQYQVTDCSLARHCFAYTGTKRELNIRLVQTGSRARGLFVDGHSAAEIEGDVSSDGTLTMTGHKAPVTSRDGSFSVTNLRIQLTSPRSLQGTFTFESRIAASFEYPYPGLNLTGTIVSSTRSDLSALTATADGTYRGSYVVRSCAAISIYCSPDALDEIVDLTLTVRAFGSAVEATYQRGGTQVPLKGTQNGRSLEMAGEATTVVSGGLTLDRITNWRGSIDAFGRMSGTFHLDHVFPIASPRSGGSAECEIVQLVKVLS